MQIELDKMCGYEATKAAYLQLIARKLNMDLSGHGHLAVNQSSGNTYLWLEEYNFTLYIPIVCNTDNNNDLCIDSVYVLYSDPDDGTEYEIQLSELGLSLQAIEEWVTSVTNN